MKSLLLATIITCSVTGSVPGPNARPNDALEQTIRRLELAERDAVLRSDVAALEKLWAEDFTVNNPNNQISRGGRKSWIAFAPVYLIILPLFGRLSRSGFMVTLLS